MIIGINGYAGSGKDTVGKIIQYLHCYETGDVSLEEAIKLNHHSWWLEDQSEWKIKKWAGKLKTIATLLTGIPEEKFEDQEFKKTYLDQEWSNHGMPMTVREFLQKLGTDGLRDGLHSNTWVNALMVDYKPIKQYVNYGVTENGSRIPLDVNVIYPNWIITDTRFPNEAAAIKRQGGVVIRIDRPGVSAINTHPSETALDKWDFDYKIANVSDIQALTETIKIILKKENLLSTYEVSNSK